MEEISGYAIHGVGSAGAADEGRLVHFELMDSQNQKMRFLVPYERMNLVLLALQAAMQLAAQELAKKPGYNPTHDSLKLGLKSFGTAVATAANKPPLVGLHLNTELGVVLDLMLPEEQARQIGIDLIRCADQTKDSRPPQLS